MKKPANRNRKMAYAVCGLILTAVCLFRFFAYGQEEPEETVVYKEETVQSGDLVQGITERGSLVLQTTDQVYDVHIEEEDTEDEEDEDESGRYLKVEAVYVKQGQRIHTGDPILKVTQDSIRSVRRYLESERANAEILLEELENTYEVEQVKAENNRRKSLTDQTFAETVYMVDMAQIETDLALLEDSVAVLEQEIRQIETDLEDGWEAYADLKKSYETYKKRYEEWDPDNLYTYIPLRTEYLESKKRYEDETEKRLEQRETMADKQEEADKKQEEIERLQKQADSRQMEARQAYETAALDGDMAQEIYAYSLQEQEQDIKTAREDLESLNRKLAELHAFVGDDGVVYAGEDGLVTQVYYEAGDTLREDSALITYAGEHACVLSVDVTEEDISSVKVGNDVEIVFTACPETTYTGKVEEIVSTEPSPNTAMVSYPVTVRVEGDTAKLYGGMTGDVTFVTGQVTEVLYVSRKAVLKENDASSVLMRDADGVIVRRAVETGFSDGVHVQIVSGLSEGDTVCIETKMEAGEETGVQETSPGGQE